MIFIQFDENGNELYRHYKPELLTKDQLSKGVLIQNVPEPTNEQSGALKYDGQKLYYEDLKIQELEIRTKAAEDATLQLLLEGMMLNE